MDFEKFLVPDFSAKAKLSILPLAPLSMVTVLPGSYYRSVRTPSKHMICGLFENILNMHYDQKTRSSLLNKISKHLKKKFDFQVDKSQCKSASGYVSILYPLFEIGVPLIPETIAYNDLWTQHLKGRDERHTKGVRNFDFRTYQKIGQIEVKFEKLIQQADDESKKNLTKEFNEEMLLLKREEATSPNIPNFYQSPKRREFITARCYKEDNELNNYIIPITTNTELLKALMTGIQENNTAYLGTSEGWVNLEIEKT